MVMFRPSTTRRPCPNGVPGRIVSPVNATRGRRRLRAPASGPVLAGQRPATRPLLHEPPLSELPPDPPCHPQGPPMTAPPAVAAPVIRSIVAQHAEETL